MTCKLVLARLHEDVSWVPDHLPENWTCDIVQKEQDVPNLGRGESSYLWWMLTHWNALTSLNTVCFSQAWPFDHVPNFELKSVDHFTPLGGVTAPILLSQPVDQFVALEWARLLGESFPDTGVDFPAGSCFLVPAKLISDKPRSLYEGLYDYVTQTRDFHSHILERLWPGVFNGV